MSVDVVAASCADAIAGEEEGDLRLRMATTGVALHFHGARGCLSFYWREHIDFLYIGGPEWPGLTIPMYFIAKYKQIIPFEHPRPPAARVALVHAFCVF